MRELTDRHWDAVVIGTGMGGGVAGRALAEAGFAVTRQPGYGRKRHMTTARMPA